MLIISKQESASSAMRARLVSLIFFYLMLTALCMLWSPAL